MTRRQVTGASRFSSRAAIFTRARVFRSLNYPCRKWGTTRSPGSRGRVVIPQSPVCSGFLDLSSSYTVLESLWTHKNVLLSNCARLGAYLKAWKNSNTFKLILTATLVQWDHHCLGVWRAFCTSHCNKELQHTVAMVVLAYLRACGPLGSLLGGCMPWYASWEPLHYTEAKETWTSEYYVDQLRKPKINGIDCYLWNRISVK